MNSSRQNRKKGITGYIRQPLLLLLSLFITLPTLTYGQAGVRYIDLLRQNQHQQVFIDQIALPTTNPDQVDLTTVIKIYYPFLSFKKGKVDYNASNEKAFYAASSFNVELFKIPGNEKPPQRRKELMELKLAQYESAARISWRDTAFASTYEDTQVKNSYLTGFAKVTVPPGRYFYHFELNRQDSNTPYTPLRKTIRVHSNSSDGRASFILLDKKNEQKGRFPIMLMGNSVHYGKDFNLLFEIPGYDESESYQLKIRKIDIANRDTTSKGQIYEQDIPKTAISSPSLLEIEKAEQDLFIKQTSNNKGTHFANLTIPNSTFPNAHYRITIFKKNQKKPLGSMVYQSKWVDIPVSLLNVDVALDMLRFIIPESKIKEMKKGSQKEKEDAFNNFWKKRDPTPDTQFNELMAEYYNRIDNAFKEYSTPNKPGFETDQGRVYISYGPPQNIDRKFPTNSPAIEIWKYPNRTFRFQATSGFGDFKLIDKTSTK